MVKYNYRGNMIHLIIMGFVLYLNITAIIAYNKNIYTDEEIIYRIYPQNLLVIGIFIYVLLCIGIEVGIFIDDIIIQKNVIILNNGLSILIFISKIILYIELIMLFISCVIILQRKSVIINDKIVTRYGVFQISEIDSIVLEGDNKIHYDLKKQSIHSMLSFKNFKIKEKKGKEIVDFIKSKKTK